MFFQSLLPSFSLQQQGQQLHNAGENGAVAQMVPGGVQGQQQLQQQQHDDIAGGQRGDNEGIVIEKILNFFFIKKIFITGAVGGIQSYAELRTSLNSIVDAMRDFLSNIRVPERPNDADVDDDESTSNEANDLT